MSCAIQMVFTVRLCLFLFFFFFELAFSLKADLNAIETWQRNSAMHTCKGKAVTHLGERGRLCQPQHSIILT